MKAARASGFTLVELLVVIAIMAILSCLAIAGIEHALNAAKAGASMVNLRSLAAANLTYVGDNNGYFCPAQEPTNTVRWHGARVGGGNVFDPTKGYLSPYLDYSSGVRTDPLFQPTVTGGGFEDGSGGYGYNEIYIGGTPANTYKPALAVSVPHASRTVMFTTTALAMSTGLQEYPFSEAPQWVDGSGNLAGALQPSCHFRANGRALVAWCDGHVTAELPSQLGGTDYYGGNSQQDFIGWFGPVQNNGYWNPNFNGPDDSSSATASSP